MANVIKITQRLEHQLKERGKPAQEFFDIDLKPDIYAMGAR